jgi:hypothetical protein
MKKDFTGKHAETGACSGACDAVDDPRFFKELDVEGFSFGGHWGVGTRVWFNHRGHRRSTFDTTGQILFDDSNYTIAACAQLYYLLLDEGGEFEPVVCDEAGHSHA